MCATDADLSLLVSGSKASRLAVEASNTNAINESAALRMVFSFEIEFSGF
jgi:hypothetical protein